MIPVLYNHSEKEFTSNGLGRLTECTSCIVTEERNGVFECEFTYPISGRHYEEIAEGCIIFVTHDNSGIPQPFDVYRRSVPINGEVTFNAAHVSYRLGKTVLMPYTATSCADALAKIKNNCIPQCDFTFTTDKSVVRDFELAEPTAAKAILCGVEGSILDIFGTGEYKFDKFRVSLYLHRGRDTDVQIRYGKNLVDMTDEIDSSETYTAVIPFWRNIETGAVKMLPEIIVRADDAPIYLNYWTNQNGRRISDENGNDLEFATYNIAAVTLDLSADFDEEPTDEQMLAKAQASANEHKLYTQSLSVDFVQLAQSEEYKDLAPLQELNLCDTCEVIYNNRPVRLKVVETEYDALADRYTSLTLGDPPKNYADVLTGEISEKLDIVPTTAEMNTAIAYMSDTIKGVNGGNVVFRYQNGKPYEILIMDTEDVNTARNVLRMNMNGIGFSHTGVDGEYVTAWTLDGNFLAQFITSGTIRAASGLASWNLDTSELNSYAINQRLTMAGARFDFFGATAGEEQRLGHIDTFWTTAKAKDLGIEISHEKGRCISLGYTNNNMHYPRLFLTDATSDSNLAKYVKHDCAVTAYALAVIHDFHVDGAAHLHNGATISGDLDIGGMINSGGGIEIRATYIDQYYITDWYSYVLTVNLRDLNYPALYIRKENEAGPPSGGKGCTLIVRGGGYFTGDVSALTVTQRSDEQEKNIWEYETAYDEVIDELEPISYTWRENDDTTQHVGLGARQTRRILEEHGLYNAGIVTDKNDQYGINYAELSVMLLKRVQDQTKQIKALTERLERLEAVINANT